MGPLLLKYLRPMTWLLWGLLAIGFVDHFLLAPRGIGVIPPAVFDWLILALWPLLLGVWFGWKQKEKLKAQGDTTPAPDDTRD